MALKVALAFAWLFARRVTQGLSSRSLSPGKLKVIGLARGELFLHEEPPGAYLLRAVASVEPGVQRPDVLGRQVGAGQQGLTFAKEADRIGVVRLQLL